MNLDGPVRVADTVGSGTASVTLSFDNWKGAKVAPTTHAVVVSPAKAGPKAEPVAEDLVATLVHPDRKASVWTVKFFNDGTRLFASGYPSGIVQIFDVANRKEVRRIDTPAGLRGSANYALLTPDWKALYVPIEKSKAKAIEKDGKKAYRIEYSGPIRVWDLTTGEEKESIEPAADSGSVHATLSPDGQFLVCVERSSYDSDGNGKDATVIWNLKTGAKRKLGDGYLIPAFAPDGKTLAVRHYNYEAKTSDVRLHDAATFKELAKLDCPEKDRQFSLDAFSSDGSVIAVNIGGKKGAPREVWFRDAKTLEDRGRFVGEANPDRHGWGGGKFTPDGKKYVIFGLKGEASVWDVAAKKVVRTFEIGADSWQLAISANSKTLAVAWAPKRDAGLEEGRDPDPRDYPQPRVTLFDLVGTAPPRTLIAPHGFTGGVAFSPDGKTLAFGTSGGVRLFDLTK